MAKSRLYEDMKKGWKVNIGKDINEMVRTHVFDLGWSYTDLHTDKMYRRILDNFFVKKVIASTTENDQIEELKDFLRQKIIDSFEKFATQKPTAKQVYYYTQLCADLGEKVVIYETYRPLHDEIKRLLAIQKEQGKPKLVHRPQYGYAETIYQEEYLSDEDLADMGAFDE